MSLLPLKKVGFLQKIKVYFYSLICNDIKRITLKLYKKEKHFCKYDKESQEIQETLSKRKEKATKFEQVEEIAPLIQSGLNEAVVLQQKLEFCSDLVGELYIACKQGNKVEIEKIFGLFREIGVFKINIENGVKKDESKR